MKSIYLNLILLFISSFVFSQINVQTSPNDVIADENPFLDASGYTRFDANTAKGLYYPRTDLTKWVFNTNSITRTKFTTAFDGMIVYNTASGNIGQNVTGGHNAATQGQQVKVKPGFYYFSNPTGNRTTKVQNGKWVAIGGDAASVKAWALGGNATIQQATIGANNEVSGDYIGANDGNALVFATRGTVVDGGTTSTKNIARLVIGGDGAGNIIKEPMDGGTKQFDFALKVFGKARFTEGIVTSRSTYPDYVFDNYFTGKSEVNPSYQFMNLDEVEQFIKENNHLPGVTKIDDLSKDGDAYMVDVSETSMQTLEKVEELYLHVIEQQKQIKALKAEIAELKKK